jgi:hypothetical protein
LPVPVCRVSFWQAVAFSAGGDGGAEDRLNISPINWMLIGVVA